MILQDLNIFSRVPIFDKVAGSSSRWQVEAMSGFGGSWWFLVVPGGSWWWFVVVPSGSWWLLLVLGSGRWWQ